MGQANKYLAKRTVDGRTNIKANLWNVSGGVKVPSNDVVSVKINSDWLGVDQGQVELTLAMPDFDAGNICKLAGQGVNLGYPAYFHDFENYSPEGTTTPLANMNPINGYFPAAQIGYIQRMKQVPGASARSMLRIWNGRAAVVWDGKADGAYAGFSGLASSKWMTVPANTGTQTEYHFKRDPNGFLAFNLANVGNLILKRSSPMPRFSLAHSWQ